MSRPLLEKVADCKNGFVVKSTIRGHGIEHSRLSKGFEEYYAYPSPPPCLKLWIINCMWGRQSHVKFRNRNSNLLEWNKEFLIAELCFRDCVISTIPLPQTLNRRKTSTKAVNQYRIFLKCPWDVNKDPLLSSYKNCPEYRPGNWNRVPSHVTSEPFFLHVKIIRCFRSSSYLGIIL